MSAAKQRESWRGKSVPKLTRIRLWLEPLENRVVPSTSPLEPALDAGGAGEGEFHAMIVAGASPDSAANRVDANTTTSQYAGVGSVRINARRGVYIGTGTPIDSTHILTAGHVVDLNSDGKSNTKDGIQSAYFYLNYGGNLTHKILVTAITVNPNFTGFNRPSINDDLAILTLSSPLPAGVPTYGLPTSDLTAGTKITLVGYGQSGDGVNGYTVGASFSVKRSGENNADAFYGQDDNGGLPAANEVFRFDFDGPSGNGTFGGATLGNDRETTLGGGDSGGPSFVGNTIVGVNTFTQGFTAPRFGSLGGGINVFPYVDWINGVMSATSTAVDESSPGNSGGNNGNGPGGTANEMREFLQAVAAADNLLAQIDAASTARTTVVFVNVPAVPARATATAANPAAANASTTPVYIGYQTTAQFVEEPAVPDDGANPDEATPRRDRDSSPQRRTSPDSSDSPQSSQSGSPAIDATIFALALAEQDADLFLAPLCEASAATGAGAEHSLGDGLIPHSTAALAGLLMLAGGRQGLLRDESTRTNSKRSGWKAKV